MEYEKRDKLNMEKGKNQFLLLISCASTNHLYELFIQGEKTKKGNILLIIKFWYGRFRATKKGIAMHLYTFLRKKANYILDFRFHRCGNYTCKSRSLLMLFFTNRNWEFLRWIYCKTKMDIWHDLIML